MAKIVDLFCSLLLLQLAYSDRVNDAMTWTLNETILSCNQPKQQLDIPGGEYDAIFVELEAMPPIIILFCPNPDSSDSLLSLSFSTGEKVDGSECPNRLRSQWLIHEKHGISIAVERKQRTCDDSFSLNVNYHFWRCWEKRELTAENIPFTMEDLCGQISIESTVPFIRTVNRCNRQSNCLLFKNIPPFSIQPGIESLVWVDINIRPKEANAPLRNLCEEIDIYLDNGVGYLSICHSKYTRLFSIPDVSFTIKVDVYYNVPIRNLLSKWPAMYDSWSGNVAFEEYLKQQDQDTIFAAALLKFYDIKINVKFGIFSKQYHLQDEDTRIPIQLRQNSLDMTIQLLPIAILSFSTWIYRIELQVAPGKQMEVRWNPLQQVDYYFTFWEGSSMAMADRYNTRFRRFLGNYSSGYATSINNAMTMEVTMSQLVSCTSLESKEGRGGITVIRFEVIPMTDACDEQLRSEMNVSVRRTVLENGEAFHVEKERYLYQDSFNCKLIFRTLTDNSVFLARMYLLIGTDCTVGRLYIQIGSRYVSLCGNNLAGSGFSSKSSIPHMSYRISERYVFIVSGVITVIAYIPLSKISVDPTYPLGMRGYLFTTCPLVHFDSDNTPPCAWHSQPDRGDESYPVYCNSLSTSLVRYHSNRATWCSSPSLSISSNASWHATISQLNFTAINLYNDSGIDQPIEGFYLIFSSYTRYVLVNLTFPLENSFLEIQFEFDSISNSSDKMLNIDDSLGTMFLSHNPSLHGIRLRTITPWLQVWYIKRQPSFLMKYTIRNYTQNHLVTAANAGPASRSSVLTSPPSSSPLSWTESQDFCRKKNSSLVVIADRNELEQILAAMISWFEQGKRLFIYLGLRREGHLLSWLDASVPLSFTEWFKPSDFIANELPILPSIFNLSKNTPQPTTNNGDCVAMIPLRPSGPANWVMVPCSQQVNDSNVTLVQMCMTRIANGHADIRPLAPSFCQAGWILLENTCYKMVFSVNMSRDSADAICRRNDALVAHFNVLAHNHLFRILLQRHTDGSKWMNDAENNQMTSYHLLSDVTMELVPTSDVTATGVVCERDIVQSVVFLQHHFEMACDDTSIISFHRWCDGTADCPHREDESTCSSVHVSTQPRRNRNDSSGNETWSDADRAAFTGWIEPDRQSVERRNTTDVFNVANEWNLPCKDDEMRCPAEENVSTPCIPETHFCVYGVAGCPDQSHLLSCDQFECPRMFKCPSTYCVPFHLVCDDHNDCPHGDDELSCATICEGLYRCRNRCIPFTAVCDGVVQCEDGDDEWYCPRPSAHYCPAECECHDTTIHCSKLTTPLLVPIVSQVVDLSSSNLTSLDLIDLSVASWLLSLNVSHNSLSALPAHRFLALSSLHTLDLSHNAVKKLQRGSFDGLSSVEVILFTGNPISTIEPYALSPLVQVASLDLSYLAITHIEGYTFADMRNLSDIDLSNNAIVALEKAAFFAIPSLKNVHLEYNSIQSMDQHMFQENTILVTLISDVKELCCATTVTGTCLPAMEEPGFCQHRIPRTWMQGLVAICVVVCFGGNAAVWVWMGIRRKVVPISVPLLVFLVNEMAVGVHLLHLLIKDFTVELPFFLSWYEWPMSTQCQGFGMLATSALLGSSLVVVHMAVAYLLQKRWLPLLFVVVLLQLSVIPAYFLFKDNYYSCLPSCVRGVFLAGEGWWLSVVWSIVIGVIPLPIAFLAARHWRRELTAFKGFRLRQIFEREEKLDILRMHVLIVGAALGNIGVAAVWVCEAFEMTGLESEGLVWSSLVAVPLRTIFIFIVYAVSLLASHRARKK